MGQLQLAKIMGNVQILDVRMCRLPRGDIARCADVPRKCEIRMFGLAEGDKITNFPIRSKSLLYYL